LALAAEKLLLQENGRVKEKTKTFNKKFGFNSMGKSGKLMNRAFFWRWDENENIFWDLATFITTFFLETFSTFFAFEIGAVDARQMAP
jgi:hypothetical protein